MTDQQTIECVFIRDARAEEDSVPHRRGDVVLLTTTSMERWAKRGAVVPVTDDIDVEKIRAGTSVNISGLQDSQSDGKDISIHLRRKGEAAQYLAAHALDFSPRAIEAGARSAYQSSTSGGSPVEIESVALRSAEMIRNDERQLLDSAEDDQNTALDRARIAQEEEVAERDRQERAASDREEERARIRKEEADAFRGEERDRLRSENAQRDEARARIRTEEADVFREEERARLRANAEASPTADAGDAPGGDGS